MIWCLDGYILVTGHAAEKKNQYYMYFICKVLSLLLIKCLCIISKWIYWSAYRCAQNFAKRIIPKNNLSKKDWGLFLLGFNYFFKPRTSKMMILNQCIIFIIFINFFTYAYTCTMYIGHTQVTCVQKIKKVM